MKIQVSIDDLLSLNNEKITTIAKGDIVIAPFVSGAMIQVECALNFDGKAFLTPVDPKVEALFLLQYLEQISDAEMEKLKELINVANYSFSEVDTQLIYKAVNLGVLKVSKSGYYFKEESRPTH